MTERKGVLLLLFLGVEAQFSALLPFPGKDQLINAHIWSLQVEIMCLCICVFVLGVKSKPKLPLDVHLEMC